MTGEGAIALRENGLASGAELGLGDVESSFDHGDGELLLGDQFAGCELNAAVCVVRGRATSDILDLSLHS